MVEILYCRNLKTIYVIHSPETYETARQLEEEIREMINEKNLNIDIHRLNTGTEWDSKRATEVIYSEDCIDYAEFLKELEM